MTTASLISPPLPTNESTQPQAPGSTVASLRNLQVCLSRRGQQSQILHGINLDIGRAEILGIVGESGSGKSVMAMAMLGLLPASSYPQVTGRLDVVGLDMLNAPADQIRVARRERLGVVFQDPMTSLNPTMLVGNQIMEKTGDKRAAIALMRSVGIPQPERRYTAYPHQLSGGLRQRIMIAIALAGKPELIIADEPTTALDVTVQAQVLKLINSMRDDLGCSVVMITHDLGVAAQVADRIAVMYRGRIVEIGSTEQVLHHPRHPYTLGLLGSRLSLTSDRGRQLWALPTESAQRAASHGCAFMSRCLAATEECTSEVPQLTRLGMPSRGAESDPHEVACFQAETLDVADLASEEMPQLPELPEISAGMPLLTASDVHCTFKVRDHRGRKAQLAALRGVGLSLQPGESIAIVGESGSGKSTLLRVAGGLEKQFSGNVHRPGGTAVQMVFQDAGSSLTPWLTVREMLYERLGRKLSKEVKETTARQMMDRVGLPGEILGAKPSEMSGGQRQRVALARATIVTPKVLLCDEPTSALDVSVAANVLNLINRLRRDLDLAVLFVTHDLAVARIISDRIAVMYLGQIVEMGRAEDVIANPRHPYTRSLVDAVPQPGVEVTPLAGEPASPLDPPSGCAFHPRCPMATEQCAMLPFSPQLTAINARSSSDLRRHEVACIREGELS
ncbi:MAG: ABC transporter ATP-binding protein [Propionibacterium sp.]|nr:ABC transporter ATP-binding protein [Propionibacterium sp.]